VRCDVVYSWLLKEVMPSHGDLVMSQVIYVQPFTRYVMYVEAQPLATAQRAAISNMLVFTTDMSGQLTVYIVSCRSVDSAQLSHSLKPYEKLVRVNSREKLVRVSCRLAARYFSREFLASNRACSISCKFLVRLSWALELTTSYFTFIADNIIRSLNCELGVLTNNESIFVY